MTAPGATFVGCWPNASLLAAAPLTLTLALPGREVVAGAGGVGGRAGTAAAGDVVVVAGGEAVQLGQQLAGAVQRPQAVEGPALVGDGDQRRPLRGGGAGAAELRPRGGGAV